MPSDDPRFQYATEIETSGRPRGILSKRDRQFLLEETYRADLTPQSRRNVRSRIRKRLHHAILDFFLLDEYLDDRDHDRVFADPEGALVEGLHAAMAVLYRAADSNPATFGSWLEGGLTHIELDDHSRMLVDRPSVELSITPAESVDPAEIDEKIEAGKLDDLSPAELRFLLWRAGRFFGDIDSDNPYLSALGLFVKRFEEETHIADAREFLETDE